MNNIKLSIIVPCYNEEKNIAIFLKDFGSLLIDNQNIELLLVDNGSTDSTGKAIDSEITKNNYKFAKKVVVKNNIGYGAGILAGLKEAKGELLAWTHADLQTNPEDVIRAYNLYLEKSKEERKIFIKGHRKNRKLSEKIFSFCMQILASMSLGTFLSEINAQPKLFPRSFYNLMAYPPLDFSLDLYALYLAKKNGYELISLPVFFKERLHGESKGGSGSDFKTRWKLIKRSLNYILNLRSKLLKEKDSLNNVVHKT